MELKKIFEGVEDFRKGWFDRLLDDIETRLDRDEATDEDYVAIAAIGKLSKLGVEKGLKALTPEEGETLLKLYQLDVSQHGRHYKDISSVMGMPAGATRKMISRGLGKARKEANSPARRSKLKDIASQLGSDKAIVDPWDVADIEDPSLSSQDGIDEEIYEDFKKLAGEGNGDKA